MTGSWVRLDADFHAHPKVLEVGLAGAGLYASALAYCGDYRTDGLVPVVWVESRAAGLEGPGGQPLPQALVDVGLWVREGRHYRIPDFLELNLSKEEWEELTEARSKAGKAGAEARWQKHRETPAKDGKNGKPHGKPIAREREREQKESPNGDSSKRLESQVAEVYGYHREKLGRDGARKKPTAKMAGHIRARLEGPYSVADLKRVVDIVAASKWHRERGFTGANLLFRSDDQVDSYLDRGAASTSTKGHNLEPVVQELRRLSIPEDLARAGVNRAYAAHHRRRVPTASEAREYVRWKK